MKDNMKDLMRTETKTEQIAEVISQIRLPEFGIMEIKIQNHTLVSLTVTAHKGKQIKIKER